MGLMAYFPPYNLWNCGLERGDSLMAYFTPYVDASGLHIPNYTDIRDALIENAQNIYGADIYLENDSADYQYISAIALKIYDTLLAVELAYNNRAPRTAIGSGLDGIVKLNGLARLPASYSTCQILVTGTAGTVITNGIARDESKYLWNLPATVTIPPAGEIEVSAVCQTIGAIGALPGTINKIYTPTSGWIEVTNEVAAIEGNPVETDAELRARQAISVSLPSNTLLAGTAAGILTISNVTRSMVYENDTNVTSVDGFPPHSITAVVEGGTDEAIANIIYNNKGIGCYTNGTTSVVIEDAYGVPTTIRFYRPSYKIIDVTVNVKKLVGHTDETTDEIKQAIADYLNSLEIGTDLAISSLWGAGLSVMPTLKNPMFSITSLTAGLHGQAQGTSDIVVAFNEVTEGDIANVTVNAA